MEEEQKRFREVKFVYYPGGARYYYLVTGNSGYPSAEFRYPGLLRGAGASLVVPETRPDSANILKEQGLGNREPG